MKNPSQPGDYKIKLVLEFLFQSISYITTSTLKQFEEIKHANSAKQLSRDIYKKLPESSKFNGNMHNNCFCTLDLRSKGHFDDQMGK